MFNLAEFVLKMLSKEWVPAKPRMQFSVPQEQKLGSMRLSLLNFDDNARVTPQSSRHTKMSSKEDELGMIKDLRKLKPFKVIPGRKHSSFSNMTISPLTNLDMDQLYNWLDKHKYQIGIKM